MIGPAIEQVVLKKIQIGVSRYIPHDLLLNQSLDVSEYLEASGEVMAISLRGSLLGKELHPVEHRYPRNWWEALKERWFPRWARARWPVLYTHLRVEFREVYPDFKPALPQNSREFRVAIMQQPSIWSDY